MHIVERIKDIHDYPTYQTIVEGCRLAAARLDCLPIEAEPLLVAGCEGLLQAKAGSPARATVWIWRTLRDG